MKRYKSFFESTGKMIGKDNIYIHKSAIDTLPNIYEIIGEL